MKSTSEYREYPIFECRVVDGDTVDVLVDQGFYSMRWERLRLASMDAWEIRRPTLQAGRDAKRRLAELVKSADRLRVRTYKDKKDREKRGKWRRFIADLEGFVDGTWHDFGRVLVNEGHAVHEDYD